MPISHRNHKQPKNNHPTTIARATPSVETKTVENCTNEPTQRRWLIIVQHEVVMYGEDKEAAQRSLSRSEFFKDRVNLQCVYIAEIPLHEKQEPIIDQRKAPGS